MRNELLALVVCVVVGSVCSLDNPNSSKLTFDDFDGHLNRYLRGLRSKSGKEEEFVYDEELMLLAQSTVDRMLAKEEILPPVIKTKKHVFVEAGKITYDGKKFNGTKICLDNYSNYKYQKEYPFGKVCNRLINYKFIEFFGFAREFDVVDNLYYVILFGYDPKAKVTTTTTTATTTTTTTTTEHEIDEEPEEETTPTDYETNDDHDSAPVESSTESSVQMTDENTGDDDAEQTFLDLDAEVTTTTLKPKKIRPRQKVKTTEAPEEEEIEEEEVA